MSEGIVVYRVADGAVIARWLRSHCGATVVALPKSTGNFQRFICDGDTLNEWGLLLLANVRRRNAGLPPFAWDAPRKFDAEEEATP